LEREAALIPRSINHHFLVLSFSFLESAASESTLLPATVKLISGFRKHFSQFAAPRTLHSWTMTPIANPSWKIRRPRMSSSSSRASFLFGLRVSII
jgi:hypothetical protein